MTQKGRLDFTSGPVPGEELLLMPNQSCLSAGDPQLGLGHGNQSQYMQAGPYITYTSSYSGAFRR